MSRGTASSGENLLCAVGLRRSGMQWVGHPKGTNLLAGSLWEDMERVPSLHLLSYLVVSQSTLMAQDIELAHLFKNSYWKTIKKVLCARVGWMLGHMCKNQSVDSERY